MSVAGTSSTDPNLIKAGTLFPYTKTVDLYKCLADVKTQPNAAGVKTLTTRSMSMNCWMNPINIGTFGNGVMHLYKKQTDIRSAVNTWVTIDEAPSSINDGWFVCDPTRTGIWVDVPASYHDRAGGISFADGHSQIKRWTDSTVLTYGMPNAPQANNVSEGTPAGDLKWLRDLSTF